MNDSSISDISPAQDDVVLQPRAGWAEASKALAEVGEDDLIWLEFPNLDDNTLQW